ncbi:MAG TPA: hypothetical protein VGI79_10215 [Caulobacteraceae bacterium]
MLSAAITGLATERGAAPDYSESLGEIASDVARTAEGVGKLASSPALALSPAELARQIALAGTEVRLKDQVALQAALRRAAGDLRGWVDTARLASVQNWRLVQVGLATLVGGALGVAGEAGGRPATPGSVVGRRSDVGGRRSGAVAGASGRSGQVQTCPKGRRGFDPRPRCIPTCGAAAQRCEIRPRALKSVEIRRSRLDRQGLDMAIYSLFVLMEGAMLTHKIDGALDALLACMMRLPALRDCYRPGTVERVALDDLMASLQRTDAVLFDRGAVLSTPSER